jgi:NAD(P)-dependent dehydrogenase (short-subunit alcohol dehydrogenase family)
MSSRHAGRIAVVTGGSSGIGQAIAARLAADGAQVAILDVADASGTVELARSSGGRALWVPCDLAQPEQIRAAVEAVRSSAGIPQILVHAAAVQFVRPFAELSAKDWSLAQAVNQESAFHLAQSALPGMQGAGWGRIILIVSSTFFVGGVGMTHYVTSKGALIGFAHGLAGEVGAHGITVNCVAPGLTRTAKAVADLPDEFFRHIASVQSIKRNGTPEDQAGVVSFLASDDAAFITGQTLVVDGGQART